MLLSSTQIQNYVPQSEPFIMVDSLLKATSTEFETQFSIAVNNLFLDQHFFRESGMIENMAQSCAVGLAWNYRHDKSRKADGYLGAISHLEVYKLPEIGDVIHTSVLLKQQFGKLYMFSGTVHRNNELLMQCELKLAGQ